jgi:TPR repeat protein
VQKKKAWAQSQKGALLFEMGDHARGVTLIQKAVNQGYLYASLAGMKHKEGNVREAQRLYKMSAEKGLPDSQLFYFRMWLHGQGGPKDIAEAVRWLSLSAYHGCLEAQTSLAQFFREPTEGYLAKSYERSMYWNEKLATTSLPPGVPLESIQHWTGMNYPSLISQAQYNLACDIICINQQYLNAIITGHSPLPRQIYWLEKARGNGYEAAEAALREIDDDLKKGCAYCSKLRESCKSLNRCSRCKGAYYCGKECQKMHWRKGHKVDPVKADSTNKQLFVTTNAPPQL